MVKHVHNECALGNDKAIIAICKPSVGLMLKDMVHVHCELVLCISHVFTVKGDL